MGGGRVCENRYPTESSNRNGEESPYADPSMGEKTQSKAMGIRPDRA